MPKLKYKSNFFIVPHKLLEQYIKKISKTTFIFMMILLKLENRYGQQFFQSDSQIHKKFDISPSSSKKARKQLKALGLIDYKNPRNKRSKKRTATEYTIVPNKKFRTVEKRRKMTEEIQEQIEVLIKDYDMFIGETRNIEISPELKNNIFDRLQSFSFTNLRRAIRRFCVDAFRMKKHAQYGPVWFFKSDERIKTFLALPSLERELGPDILERLGKQEGVQKRPRPGQKRTQYLV